MKKLRRFLCVVFYVVLCLAAEGPAGDLPLEWGNLEGAWHFRTDPYDVGEKEGWARPEYTEAGWRSLIVPGGWEKQGVTEPRPGQQPKPKNEKVQWTDYDGVAWYRLRFIVPKAWEGQDLILHLGSVDDEDRTFLNGNLVGATGPGIKRAVAVWRIYRIPAPMVRYGQENVLAIRVVDLGGPGGMMGPGVSLLPENFMRTSMKLPNANRPLRALFENPPAGARILKIIHNWPDEPQAQDSLIRTLISQGFGGVVCNVSFTDYLESEAKWQAFVHAVEEAKKAGMCLWLYDEKGYPSGTAGDIVLRGHPEWEARGLLIAETTSQGGSVALELPPGKQVAAWALPVVNGLIELERTVDLTDHARDGRLKWEAPAGSWHVMVITEDRLYEGTHAALSLAYKYPYINLLMPEPTARFLEVTHAQYARRLGEDLGKWFVATFTDEPSLMSMFMRPMPYRVLPWSSNLPVEFQMRRGYALLPLVPALVAEAGARGKKVRYDFWLTVGELVSENYFGQIQEWCRRHNLLSGGHLLAEENLLSHVALYGDFVRCVRRLDAPSIDCLTSIPSSVPWFIARLISSVADLEGRRVTMCETSDFVQRYRRPEDKRPVQVVSEDEIRGTCNRLILNGINTITSYYSFTDITKAQLRRLNEWVGRCCVMLTGGHQVTDIALLYPIESVWVRFVPAMNGPTDSPAAHQVARVYRTVADGLFAAMRDFTYVDSRALSEARVENGALVHGNLRWRVVVLPCADTLPMGVWEKIVSFWRTGGVVVALSERPANSEREFPCPVVQALGREMFGEGSEPRMITNSAGGVGVFLPTGAEALLPKMLDALLEPDVNTPNGAPLRVTHRRIEGHEVYFVINDSAQAWDGVISLCAAGAGECWSPESGTVTPLPSAEKIALKLGPYGGTLLRFAAYREPQRLKAQADTLPKFTERALPQVRPVVTKGKFVACDGVVQESDTKLGTRWGATGVLTKGQVDTFLFLVHDFPEPLDLSQSECLVIDTWAPAGQRASTMLLVILRDADGSEYIASTGRSLAVVGEHRVYLPFGAFHLAGWSKDADGRLNLKKITSIRVGWGGHYGKEGERIQFSVGALRVICLSVPSTK